MTDKAATIDVLEIMKRLPHRYPFLLVDRVTDYVAGERLEAFKNVSINEPFFQGHFPDLPVMPGVLILEAMAQAGGLLFTLSTKDALDDKVFLYTGADKVRFRKPVVPGDKLVLRCSEFKQKMMLIRMKGEALVDGKVVAEGVITAAVAPRENM